MRRFRRFLIPLFCLCGLAGWWFRAPLAEIWQAGRVMSDPAAPRPDAQTYAVLVRDLERWRKDLAARHRDAKSNDARAAVESDARAVLEQALPAMMRCWLGTPWDFNGTAKDPGAGKIACGYFVATVLRDAGFRVDRYQLAQQASENILRSFLSKPSCDLSVGEDYQAFATALERREPGVYIVGLDTHVGFIVVDGGGFRFIHSSGSEPWCVVDESRGNATVLQRSRWRMTGNLTADPSVLKRWLRAEKIVVRVR
ncbi:MAG: hypothetical protein ACRCXD_12465 [Luteolibacter sp.]